METGGPKLRLKRKLHNWSLSLVYFELNLLSFKDKFNSYVRNMNTQTPSSRKSSSSGYIFTITVASIESDVVTHQKRESLF